MRLSLLFLLPLLGCSTDNLEFAFQAEGWRGTFTLANTDGTPLQESVELTDDGPNDQFGGRSSITTAVEPPAVLFGGITDYYDTHLNLCQMIHFWDDWSSGATFYIRIDGDDLSLDNPEFVEDPAQSLGCGLKIPNLVIDGR